MDQSDAFINAEKLKGKAKVSAGPASHFEPPTVASSAVDLANRLSRQRRPLAFTLGDAAIAFKPSGLGSITNEVLASERVILGLQLDDRPLVLQMSKSLYERMLARVDPELLLADFDKELLPLLMESCLEDAFKAAETALQSRLELTAIDIGASFDLHGLDIALEVSIDGEKAGRASLRASRNDAELLAAMFERQQKPERPFNNLKAELSFRAGTVWLNLGELKALTVGDVVMADQPVYRWDRIAATVGERWILPIELNRRGAVLCQPMRKADLGDMDEWMMVDQPDENGDEEGLNNALRDAKRDGQNRVPNQPPSQERATEASDQPADQAGRQAQAADRPADASFDDLPIKLVFELGRTDMPLGQLQEIGPGHVFELDRPLGEAVDIHAGGKRIGRGEVVRIDDQVGVRVLHLFGQNQA